MEEIWKNIKGYEGLYQVSNMGFVKSLERHDINGRNLLKEKILDGSFDSDGYVRVNLSKNYSHNMKRVHILVAEAFIPNPENKPDVHHIDHNKENNHIGNLMWVTKKQHADLHPEIINKMRNRIPKVMSKEAREKISRKRRKPVAQIDKTTGEIIRIWDSAIEVKKELGFWDSAIRDCCNGKYKQAYGFIWSYVT